jgi:hypothetical protein
MIQIPRSPLVRILLVEDFEPFADSSARNCSPGWIWR